MTIREYVRAKSKAEVLAVLKSYGKRARVIGGGTTLHDLLTRKLLADLEYLVDINDLRLNYVKTRGNHISIGASATLSSLQESRLFSQGSVYAAIADALRNIRPVQVKNTATIGGCVCSGIGFFDLPTALLAHDADVVAESSKGKRTLSLNKFHVDFLTTALRSSEFVSEVRIPVKKANSSGAFIKLALTGDDWAIVNAATVVTLQNRICKDIRVTLGGLVGPKVMRATKVEKALIGEKLSSTKITQAAQMVVDEIDPIDDIRASKEYRKEVSPVLVERALNKTCERLS